tara:strand:+ start:2587 stop:2769 length:183 start_codon:yes stop_codon:yes gene_type:complete
MTNPIAYRITSPAAGVVAIERVLRLSQDYLGLQYNKIGIDGIVEKQLPLDVGESLTSRQG